MASCNNITKKFFEAKRLTFPELHKPVTAKKICVWQWSNKDTFPLEITHVHDDECPREATRFKQSVTVHEKSRKAEPFNVHCKRAMKLILVIPCSKHNFFAGLTVRQFSLFLYHSSFSKCQHLPKTVVAGILSTDRRQ